MLKGPQDTANHAQLGIMLLRSGEVVVLALKLIKHFTDLVPDHVDKSFETQHGLEVHSGTLLL